MTSIALNPGFVLPVASIARLRAGFSHWLRRYQAARMVHVMNSFSNHQLHQIGITRAEIPDYLSMIMSNE